MSITNGHADTCPCPDCRPPITQADLSPMEIAYDQVMPAVRPPWEAAYIDQAAELQREHDARIATRSALESTVDMLTRIGGFMKPADQQALAFARLVLQVLK
jgi:hypothetical protein